MHLRKVEFICCICVRRRMFWNRGRNFGLEGSGSDVGVGNVSFLNAVLPAQLRDNSVIDISFNNLGGSRLEWCANVLRFFPFASIPRRTGSLRYT